MRKIVSTLLILATLITAMFALSSCHKIPNYEPQESTEEENTVVMTLKIDDKSYDVKYELYRALFLNYKKDFDGGDSSVWSGPDKAEYIKKINKKIMQRITEIYSAFAVCERIGFDLYSKDVDKQINEYIHESVVGGTFEGSTVTGYGTYEKYLEGLKNVNLNYSAQILLYRYSIAIDAINNHYIGTVDEDDIQNGIKDGAIEYTKENVKNFYFGDNSVRVLRVFIPANISNDIEARVERVRGAIIDAAQSGDEEKVAISMIANGSLTAESEVKNGYVIGRHNLDKAYYEEMTNVAFDLQMHEVSKAIKVHTGTEYVYYIMYKAEKSEKHFEDCYKSIEYTYLQDCVGEILDTVGTSLLNSAETTEFFNNLDYSKISMD